MLSVFLIGLLKLIYECKFIRDKKSNVKSFKDEATDYVSAPLQDFNPLRPNTAESQAVWEGFLRGQNRYESSKKDVWSLFLWMYLKF